jgi:deoxyribodipyrimidine photolyase-related protein
MGWRDYVWHLYWHFGESYVQNNALNANVDVPKSWLELAPESITSNCIRHTIGGLGERGWLHHIERLMILGNVAMQRGFNPAQLNQWFIDNFVDGTPWVMPANVIGMSQFADGGMMSTKPYAGGGSYISKMTNYCGGCQFDPKQRVGEKACPVTAGYWNFLATHEGRFRQNHRMLQPLAGLKKLADLEQILEQEANRGTNL